MINNYQRLFALYRRRLETIESRYKYCRQAVLVCEEQLRTVQAELATLTECRNQLVEQWKTVSSTRSVLAARLSVKGAMLNTSEILGNEHQIAEAHKREQGCLQKLGEAKFAMDEQATLLRKQTRKCELLEEKLLALKTEKKRQSDRKQDSAIDDLFGVKGRSR